MINLNIKILFLIITSFLPFLNCSSLDKYYDLNPKPLGQLTRNEIIEKYLSSQNLDIIEGIWIDDTNTYEIAIVKNLSKLFQEYDYLGIIIASRYQQWTKGEVKFLLKKTASKYVYACTYYTSEKKETGTTFILTNDNLIESHLNYSTKLLFIRSYPLKYENSFKEKKLTKKIGTGFFITKNLIVTSFHIIKNVKNIVVYLNDIKFNTELLLKDESNDIAILKINTQNLDLLTKLKYESITPLCIGDINNVKEGNKVYTVGYPLINELGKHKRLSEGIINSIVGIENDPRMFQISIPIQPGNSGGPLLNSKCEVIGIVTSTANDIYFLSKTGLIPQNINFAIKINYLQNLFSLLPENINLNECQNSPDYNDSEIMDRVKNSIVLIEAFE